MSWSARLTHTTTGLAIVFAGPVSRLDMSPDVAAHFAKLLATEAATPRNPNAGELGISADIAHFALENPNAAHVLCCNCDDCLNGGR